MKRFAQQRSVSVDCSRELAFESGLHRTYISGIERGVRNPTIQIIKEIADALAIPPAMLLE